MLIMMTMNDYDDDDHDGGSTLAPRTFAPTYFGTFAPTYFGTFAPTYFGTFAPTFYKK